ncbi:MAG TPA: DUF58 domain-containing protein [Trueperaceae bacterium]
MNPSLLQKLSRCHLNVRSAVASTGIGERRSKAKGVGIEFADHRPYGMGDDIRHLDRHVYARLGQHVVKQFALYQQLPITVLLDGSASMAYGHPSKFQMAQTLAAGLAYVGLAGGDQVLVGVFSGRGLQWYARLHGTRRVHSLLSWLERQRAQGGMDLAQVVRAAGPRLQRGGLMVVISDWWLGGVDEALLSLGVLEQEVVGIHLLSPEELEPTRLGGGDVRLVDAETGNEVETALDAAVLQRYGQELDAWREETRQRLQKQHGRYLFVRSDDEPERLFLRDWRHEGLIG